MAFLDSVLRLFSVELSSNTPVAICLVMVFKECSPNVAACVLPISSMCISSNLKPLRFLRSQNDGRAGVLPLTNASKHSLTVSAPAADGGKTEQEEEEVETSWVDEKVEDIEQYLRAMVRSLLGPRVAGGELPWLLALPIGYMTISLVIALFMTVQRCIAPEGKRRHQVEKNAWMVAELGEYLPAK